MSRIKVYYTADSRQNRHVSEPRWLCPKSGRLYIQEEGGYQALPNKFTEVHPGHWETELGTAVRQAPIDLPVTPEGAVVTPAEVGQKFDGDKDEPSLLMNGCALALQGVIAVLAFGFKKYGKRNGWKEVPEAPRRYKDALYRHLSAIERGELIDPESGKPHIDHVACNAVFLSQMYHTTMADIIKEGSRGL